MAQNKVMKLWTAIVIAFLALWTALGLTATTVSAAVPQTETTRNCTAPTTTRAMSLPARPHDRALPPTMKQRIRAEAHGSSPSCRHRTALDTAADTATKVTGPASAPDAPLPQADQPIPPLQR
ncbi:DUF6344 domain-containing protein [Streptomyces sp. DSM 40750]|uniref:DUF6344 domain-containing protein n=1 Tax=Streptomyces sp. DSM 40750 TaxID=2801030 RepID=UPI00214C98AB|nr:DUF6344 domain-containing protein [Streptomyces sp. DSM 40750]UUU23468.1 DUF6344 domain-containing protein [Streptomyces sp. DSM 40750]